ncbi:MAG: VOC family protein [candidate division Zixibacteria bacterium]|nr:VOC family protein [candidate division Zixibacteria bacterium]
MRFLELHIEVADLARAEQFYTTLLPHAKVTRWEDGSAIAIILDDGAAFGLWKIGKSGLHNGRGGEHVHFAFQIKRSEYDLYKERMLALGIEPIEHTWPSGDRSLYFFDPDGHQGEFMTKDWLGRGEP